MSTELFQEEDGSLVEREVIRFRIAKPGERVWMSDGLGNHYTPDTSTLPWRLRLKFWWISTKLSRQLAWLSFRIRYWRWFR